MQEAYEGKLERIRKTSKDAYKDHRNLRKDLSESIRVLEESQQNVGYQDIWDFRFFSRIIKKFYAFISS